MTEQLDLDILTQAELERYLWGAAELLRGQIDASDYKQFIFPLLFFKRLCDVYDEEYEAAMQRFDGDEEYASLPEQHRFQIPKGYHWEDVRAVTKDVGKKLQTALREIEKTNPDRLYGIFGDAPWTNKERLPDPLLSALVEHFSKHTLSLARVPQDQLGNAYEYLIKKFADDSGHTAAEFYTNRTVVHLMTQFVELQTGETIYDPTCGSGGMLLNAVLELKKQGKEYRNVKVYGQEVNLITSGIARMNLFLHDIEEFEVQRGDTLDDPKFIEGDRLKQFDMVLANPPYSIKRWNRDKFVADTRRNWFGAPPKANADYAFFQHIIASLKPETGRAAILYPHGILFRDSEAEIRRGIVEADLIEAVVGLGANLFYNSPMEACVVVLRTRKVAAREGKILFIEGVKQVTRDRAQSSLSKENEEKLLNAYLQPENHPDIARLVDLAEIQANNHNLSIPLYVSGSNGKERHYNVGDAVQAWQDSRELLQEQTESLFKALKEIGY
ncbi:MAG: SAM-dependent DNA methyltransferase [Leptolyngbya sp.]|nr:MAG: SAM-dependent DNA methyltransferase [Leptolyngbya sp.]